MQTALSATAVSDLSTRTSSDSQETSKPAADTRARPSGASPNVRLRVNRKSSSAKKAEKKTESDNEVVPAIAGNHFAIHGFLQRLLHRPSLAEFTSATQRPEYAPSERLIVKNPKNRSIAGHVQLEPQTIRHGSTEIPVSRFRDLAVLPEFRLRGSADQLVVAAESEARRLGSMLIVARGEDSALLRAHGWSVLGSDPFSVASPQALLSHLPVPAEPESPYYASMMPVVQVRIGRLTDIAEMQQAYETRFSTTSGTRIRSAEMWTWLASKRSYDRIYIVTVNDQTQGYVVVRGGSILELVDLTEDGSGGARLLQRVAADAIDQGRHSIRIHAPISDRVHTWADQAGGQVHASPTNDVWMAKCLSNRTLLRRLAHELYRRRPKDMQTICLEIDDEQLLIGKGVRSMKVTRGNTATDRVEVSAASALQMFLGYRSVAELCATGHLIPSSDTALKTVEQLFPISELWRARWDDAAVAHA